MPWRSKGDTPTRFPRNRPIANAQCATCTHPCQGGEKLHKRGPCSHSYCDCAGFTPEKGVSLTGALGDGIQYAVRKSVGARPSR